MSLVRFLLSVTAAVAAIIGASQVLVAGGSVPSLPTFFYPTVVLLALVTVVMYGYLYRIKDPAHYIQLFLLLTVVKLAACLSYCTVIVLKKRPDMKMDVLFFLAVYAIFTTIEVVFLYRKTSGKRP